jgi:hypothetical protein
MQTIRLDINNHNIFNTIMDFLNNLPQNELRVKVEKQPLRTIKRRKLNAISLKTKGFKFDREESHGR